MHSVLASNIPTIVNSAFADLTIKCGTATICAKLIDTATKISPVSPADAPVCAEKNEDHSAGL